MDFTIKNIKFSFRGVTPEGGIYYVDREEYEKVSVVDANTPVWHEHVTDDGVKIKMMILRSSIVFAPHMVSPQRSFEVLVDEC
jgi:hypothetical protein